MGLKSWLQGHGWDGTHETPAEQHARAMPAQVNIWKERYAETGQARTTTPPITYDELSRAGQRYVETWQRNLGELRRGEAGRDDLAQRLGALRAMRGMETPRALPGVAIVQDHAETVMRKNVAMVQQHAEQVRLRAASTREYYERWEKTDHERGRDRSQGWER